MNWYKQSMIKKEAARMIMYHGTSINAGRSILSQGLIANPKQRVWGDLSDASLSYPSQASYPGIYLTANPKIAFESALHANDENGSGCIVIVSIESKTLVMDEDSFVDRLRTDIFVDETSMMERPTYPMSLNCAKIYKEYQQTGNEQHFYNRAKRLLDLITDKLNGIVKEKVIETSLESVKNLYKSYFKRQAAFYQKTFSVMIKDENYIDPMQAEMEMRKYVDEVSRKLRKCIDVNSMYMTARCLENIGFSGSNKIVSILNFYEKDVANDPQVYTYFKSIYSADDNASYEYKRKLKDLYKDTVIDLK